MSPLLQVTLLAFFLIALAVRSSAQVPELLPLASAPAPLPSRTPQIYASGNTGDRCTALRTDATSDIVLACRPDLRCILYNDTKKQIEPCPAQPNNACYCGTQNEFGVPNPCMTSADCERGDRCATGDNIDPTVRECQGCLYADEVPGINPVPSDNGNCVSFTPDSTTPTSSPVTLPSVGPTAPNPSPDIVTLPGMASPEVVPAPGPDVTGTPVILPPESTPDASPVDANGNPNPTRNPNVMSNPTGNPNGISNPDPEASPVDPNPNANPNPEAAPVDPIPSANPNGISNPNPNPEAAPVDPNPNPNTNPNTNVGGAGEGEGPTVGSMEPTEPVESVEPVVTPATLPLPPIASASASAAPTASESPGLSEASLDPSSEPTLEPSSVSPATSPTPTPVCIAAHHLRDRASNSLVFATHRTARVLCDKRGSCATPGHVVDVDGHGAMAMKSYCVRLAKRLSGGDCVVREGVLVNSPRWRAGTRVDSLTPGLRFTALAARWESRAEEHMLSALVRLGA